MDLEQRLRASLVAPDPGAAFTARVMARLARSPARWRPGIILLGTVMALAAAAAAVLTWRSPDGPTPAPVVAAESPAAEEPSVAGTPAALPAPQTPVPIASVAAAPSAAVAPEVLALPQAARLFAVLVRPPQPDAGFGDREPIRALHTALLDQLRKVPGIAVREQSDGQERDAGAAAEYVVQIARAQIAAIRTVTAAGTDGVPTMAAGADDILQTDITVQPREAAAQRFPLQVRDGAMPAHCQEPGGDTAAGCRTPARLAQDVVTALRLQVFPPDPAFFQQVVAGLEEIDLGQCTDCTSFSAGERSVMEMLQRLAFDQGTRLDAVTIRAIAAYAAGQSARMRANVWSTLRWARASHPALVAPLLDILRHDPDQQVRLIAMAFLEAEFAGDPDVRAALDAVGREDADRTVRIAAQRVVRGPAQWRDDILLAMLDSSLPYEARLAPLLAGGLDVTALQAQHRAAALREPQVLAALVSLVRAQGLQPAHRPATTPVLEMLARIDDPAVSGLFMQLIRDGGLAAETAVQGNQIDLSGPLTTWIFRNRDDPRVLPLLAEVDPRLRMMVEQSGAMGDRMAPATPAPGGVPAGLAERMREVTQQAQPTGTPAH